MKCMMLLCCVFLSVVLQAQNPAADTLKAKLSRAHTPAEKVDLLGKLARSSMGSNPAESDKYAEQMNREAEISRERPLMVKALLINGDRFSYLSFKKENVTKSIEYYNQALELARKNEMDKETAQAYLGLSAIYTKVPDFDKALNYNTQALSYISNLKSDTLKVTVYNTFGGIYQLKTERILALRNYLTALRIAEEAKNSYLLRTCYSNLSSFYADLKEFDKAIDYAMRSMNQLAVYHPENEKYMRTIDNYSIGTLYMHKKDYDMSVYYYEKSIRLADSLKFAQLKMPAYEGLLQQYISQEMPRKALDLLNTRPEYKKHAENFGIGYMIDGAYGAIYNKLG
ncbi:MAG TPA: tetratricopeptide repeat protein, partial [Flavitalea sp.]|nr:tetratricopeptide repeat protein [Flavitalea sp.]